MSIIRKSLLLAISGAILASVPLAAARWHSPIHPGDHVFDAKRFADSVKETAEMVKNVRNSYEKLRNAGIYNLAANITGFEDAYNTAAESINNLSNGNTLININKNPKDAESYKYISTDEAMHDTGGIERRLRNESSERKLAELEVIANTIKNTSGRENAINNIITQQDNGVLAERQKANAVAILQNINDIDAIRMRSALFVDDIQSQEESFAAERLEEQKLKKAVFKGYDPYHPNDEQRIEMDRVSKDLGFMRIRE